jgi:hypothetical protein
MAEPYREDPFMKIINVGWGGQDNRRKVCIFAYVGDPNFPAGDHTVTVHRDGYSSFEFVAQASLSLSNPFAPAGEPPLIFPANPEQALAQALAYDAFSSMHVFSSGIYVWYTVVFAGRFLIENPSSNFVDITDDTGSEFFHRHPTRANIGTYEEWGSTPPGDWTNVMGGSIGN